MNHAAVSLLYLHNDIPPMVAISIGAAKDVVKRTIDAMREERRKSWDWSQDLNEKPSWMKPYKSFEDFAEEFVYDPSKWQVLPQLKDAPERIIYHGAIYAEIVVMPVLLSGDIYDLHALKSALDDERNENAILRERIAALTAAIASSNTK